MLKGCQRKNNILLPVPLLSLSFSRLLLSLSATTLFSSFNGGLPSYTVSHTHKQTRVHGFIIMMMMRLMPLMLLLLLWGCFVNEAEESREIHIELTISTGGFLCLPRVIPTSYYPKYWGLCGGHRRNCSLYNNMQGVLFARLKVGGRRES